MFCQHQDGLKNALEITMSKKETEENLKICRQWVAIEGVDRVIEEHKIDVIIGPCDGFFAGVGIGARTYFFILC